jgi:DNA-binding NtrC family response regulator
MLILPKVLLLSSDEEETARWNEILRDHVVLKSVRNISELQSALEGENYHALFCDWSFHMGTWHEALEQAQERCPDLPVVIFCRTGDEAEWVRVMEAGAFDLLGGPHQKRNVLPVLEHAVASSEARRRHRVLQFSSMKAR